MQDTIEKLLILQNRDRRIRHIEAELAHIEPERQLLIHRATGAQVSLEEVKSRIKHIESERKALELEVEGKPFAEYIGAKRVHPDWRITPDGATAYLQLLNDLRMFRVDLSGPSGKPVIATNLGERIKGEHPDSRGSICLGPDGRVYSAVRIDNRTGFGKGYLHHIVRHDPKGKAMEDLGVFAVRNPAFFDFKGPQAKNPDGSLRPRHGYHTLPDGTLTPLHVILAMIVTRNGTIYATTIYPFTLLKVETVKAVR
jgi:hypothetical protein